jgi:hypothetical protein
VAARQTPALGFKMPCGPKASLIRRFSAIASGTSRILSELAYRVCPQHGRGTIQNLTQSGDGNSYPLIVYNPTTPR